MSSLEVQYKLVGSCNQCGKCCESDIMWIGFDPSKPHEKECRIEWAEKRGYEIIQTGIGIIQVSVPLRCPNLTEDSKCAINNSKPSDCARYPNNMFESDPELELDLNKFLPEGCGFKFIEIDRG